MRRHPVLRKLFGIGLLGGVAYAVWRAIEANRAPGDEVGWEPQPFPFPPQPRTSDGDSAHTPDRVEGRDDGRAWVEPVEGVCPATHPVKAKLTSGIYHLPGGINYERTAPDRCYTDARAAEADGLRASKR